MFLLTIKTSLLKPPSLSNEGDIREVWSVKLLYHKIEKIASLYLSLENKKASFRLKNASEYCEDMWNKI